MNLVLTGFMGTGKTSVGRKLAHRLNMDFVDTDLEVEKVTGMSVKDLFEKHGERRFRSEEAAAVRRVTRRDNQVIATGGGVVLNRDNMAALQKNGIIFCLEADPEVIYQRVKQKKTRPLLAGENLLDTIVRLLRERQEFYQCAHYTIDTSQLTLEEAVEEIARLYTEEVNQHGKG